MLATSTNIKRWIDVRDYGAFCDGISDNRDAINRAVQAGPGSVVFFPAQANPYLWDPEIKLPVAIPNNTRLLFAPGATIELRSAFGSICNAIFTNTNPAVDPDRWGIDHDIEIDGLRLISPVRPNNSAEWFAARQDWLAADRGAGGNGSDWPSVMYGWLSFKGVRRLTIRNLYVQRLTGFKVHFSRCRDVRCYETEFFDNGQDLLHFGGYCYRVHVRNLRYARGDTPVAVTCYDWQRYGNPDGPSGDILLENIIGDGDANNAGILLEGGDFGVNTNEVQKLDFTGAVAGNFTISVQDETGEWRKTDNIVYSAVAATLVNSINAALNTLLETSTNPNPQIVASGANINNIALTFSGTKFKNALQNLVQVSNAVVTRTTQGWRANHDINNVVIRGLKNTYINFSSTPDPNGTPAGDHVTTAAAVNGVTIEDVHLEVPFDPSFINLSNTSPGVVTTVNNLIIRNVRMFPGATNGFISLDGSSVINNLLIDGYKEVAGAGNFPPLFTNSLGGNTGTINNAVVANSYFDRTGATVSNQITNLNGTINGLKFRDTTFNGLWGSMVLAVAGQTINDVVFTGCNIAPANGVGDPVIVYQNGGAIPRVNVSDCTVTNTDAVLRTSNVAPVEIHFNGGNIGCFNDAILPFPGVVTAKATNTVFNVRSIWRCVGATASIFWQGSNCQYIDAGGGVHAPNWDTKDAGQTTRVIDISLSIDLTQSNIVAVVGDLIRDKNDSNKTKMCTTAPATFGAVA